MFIRQTFLENMRQRFWLGTGIFGLLLVLSAVVLGLQTYQEQSRITCDLGAFFLSSWCILAVIYVSISTIQRDLCEPNVSTLFSRGFPRSSYIFGKHLGTMGVVASTLSVLFLAFMLILWLMGIEAGAILWQSLLLTLAEAAILAASAILFSTFCKTLLASLMTLSILILGHSHGIFVNLTAPEQNIILKSIGYFGQYLIPNFSAFNVMPEISHGITLPASQMLALLGYAVIYSLALLCIAVASLRGKNL